MRLHPFQSFSIMARNHEQALFIDFRKGNPVFSCWAAAVAGGRMPLHWAACFSHSSLAKLLLSKGATLNAVDVSGRCLS